MRGYEKRKATQGRKSGNNGGRWMQSEILTEKSEKEAAVKQKGIMNNHWKIMKDREGKENWR